MTGELPAVTHQASHIKQGNPVTTPPTANKNNLPNILTYLTQKRGLSATMVRWCIDNRLIYADSRNNCVFRYGSTGAELRGTGSIQWRAVYGSIERGFILPARHATGVAILESAIDALSYRQLHPSTITVSIAGNGNRKVIQQAVSIAKAKQLPILSAFDSDAGGDIADKILTEYAQREGVELIQDRPTTKDWNDALKNTR